jgi:cytochrome c oxidase subunit 4
MANQHQPHASHQDHHIIPYKTLQNVCIGLLVLTVLTVVTAKGIHLGILAAPVAFAIAIAKAMMVMGYFMGLKYDVKENRWIFASGYFFLALLFFFCALDIWTRIGQSSTL